MTLVALVIVGVGLFGGEGPALDTGPGSRAGEGGPLRERIGAELRPMLAEAIADIVTAYRDRAIGWGAVALVVMGAASAAAGWWYSGRLLSHAAAAGRPSGRRGSS